MIEQTGLSPLLVGPRPLLGVLDLAEPSDDMRGSISRAAVAKVTSLQRETVRRKINQLIAVGMLVERYNGEVRPVRNLIDPQWQRIADEGFAAVERYDQRLRSLGCRGIGEPSSTDKDGRRG